MIEIRTTVPHNTLVQIGGRLPHVLQDGVNHAGDGLKQRIASAVPVDTGALRDSIYSEPSSEGDGVGVVISSPLDYAVYLEYGTVKMSPHPTFIPQTEAFAHEAEQYILKAINEAVGG